MACASLRHVLTTFARAPPPHLLPTSFPVESRVWEGSGIWVHMARLGRWDACGTPLVAVHSGARCEACMRATDSVVSIPRTRPFARLRAARRRAADACTRWLGPTPCLCGLAPKGVCMSNPRDMCTPCTLSGSQPAR
eukprot:364201-Chlamydomonas_euryale.AAC.5